MSVCATGNTSETTLSYGYDTEAEAWVLNGLEYEEVDDDEIEKYTYNMYFSKDISDVANVKGNFLSYTKKIDGGAYAFAKYTESEGVCEFDCTYDGESYRFRGDDKQCDSRTFIRAYQDICEDEQSQADNRSEAWTAEELADWINAELNVVEECFEVFSYNAYYNKQMFTYAVSDDVVKTIEIPSAEELYFEDGDTFLLDDYRKDAYTLSVTDSDNNTESINYNNESYQVILSKNLSAEYENANLRDIEKPINVYFDITEFDTSVNDYYVAYDEYGEWNLDVLRNSNERLLWDSGRLGDFFVVSKASDIIATTAEGVNVTTAHLFGGGSLDLDAAGIKYTDSNMETVLEGYLDWAAEDVETSESKSYTLSLYYSKISSEDRNNDLMMEINDAAWEDLKKIQDNGGKFLINSKRFITKCL